MASSEKSPLPSARVETRRLTTAGGSAAPAPPGIPLGTAALLYLAVGAGSAIGGSIRWLLSDPTLFPFAASFPWGTLFVNVTGSFLIGLYAALTGPGGRLTAGPIQRHFFMTGVFGGYTTFSIFNLDTIRLMEAALFAAASLNVAVSIATWMLAVWGGFLLGSKISDSIRR